MGSLGRTRAPRVRAWIAALAALAVPAALWADGPDAQARRIFRALHVALELQQIVRAASAGIDASARALPPGDRLLLRAAVSAGFDPDAVEGLALDDLSAHLDADHAAAALAWLERPETRDLLLRSARPTFPATREGADADVADEPGRDALLRRFDRSGGRAARGEKDADLVLVAMLRMANRLLPPAHRYTGPEIASLLASQRARAAAASASTADLRKRYAGIPTRDLERALAFLESPAGAWLRREVDRALERALVLAAEATAAHLVASFGPGGAPLPLRMARAPVP